MENEEYTTEMYNEDFRIARFCIKKQFLNYASDKEIKNDLTCICLIKLLEARKIFNSEKGKYFSFAYKVCYNAILTYLRLNKNKLTSYNTLSLEADVKNTDNLQLERILTDNANIEDNLNCEYLLKKCYAVKNKVKSKTFNAIIEMLLQGKTRQEMQQILNCSRQNIEQYIKTFRYYLNEELLKENYIEKSLLTEDYLNNFKPKYVKRK